MNIGNNISKLRKANNLTQEQLATAVGVSIPAVSKWENGSSYPDITLLAPIARYLHTNLNELLSFQEELSDEEVKQITRIIKDTFQTKGYREGLRQMQKYSREYPNNEQLQLWSASYVTMFRNPLDNDISDEEYSKILDSSTKDIENLYKNAVNSNNPIIAPAAFAILTSRYIAANRLDDAEKLLLSQSDLNSENKHLLANIYLLQGRQDIAKESIQKNMVTDSLNIVINIRSLHTLAVQQERWSDAILLANHYAQVCEIFSFPVSPPKELLIETYLHQRDFEKAQLIFPDYLTEILALSPTYAANPYNDVILSDIRYWNNIADSDVRHFFLVEMTKNELYIPLLELESVNSAYEKALHSLTVASSN